ncbi:hypothetical protein T11_3323 [Trichinella zimbabwensis]|uniref:Uncharacterized protein n=1 Tax=Trichinella zimbabwensis TaxID=268475 RepID=A0A0V1G9R6_9BILA|nr:hypothetical protein T11_3323 [Trichinella zimbabwensis]
MPILANFGSQSFLRKFRNFVIYRLASIGFLRVSPETLQ